MEPSIHNGALNEIRMHLSSSQRDQLEGALNMLLDPSSLVHHRTMAGRTLVMLSFVGSLVTLRSGLHLAGITVDERTFEQWVTAEIEAMSESGYFIMAVTSALTTMIMPEPNSVNE